MKARARLVLGTDPTPWRLFIRALVRLERDWLAARDLPGPFEDLETFADRWAAAPDPEAREALLHEWAARWRIDRPPMIRTADAALRLHAGGIPGTMADHALRVVFDAAPDPTAGRPGGLFITADPLASGGWRSFLGEDFGPEGFRAAFGVDGSEGEYRDHGRTYPFPPVAYLVELTGRTARERAHEAVDLYFDMVERALRDGGARDPEDLRRRKAISPEDRFYLVALRLCGNGPDAGPMSWDALLRAVLGRGALPAHPEDERTIRRTVAKYTKLLMG